MSDEEKRIIADCLRTIANVLAPEPNTEPPKIKIRLGSGVSYEQLGVKPKPKYRGVPDEL